MCALPTRDVRISNEHTPIWANVSIATIVREILSNVANETIKKHKLTIQNIENSQLGSVGLCDFQNLDTELDVSLNGSLQTIISNNKAADSETRKQRIIKYVAS